jgi:hypothetical protein
MSEIFQKALFSSVANSNEYYNDWIDGKVGMYNKLSTRKLTDSKEAHVICT